MRKSSGAAQRNERINMSGKEVRKVKTRRSCGGVSRRDKKDEKRRRAIGRKDGCG